MEIDKPEKTKSLKRRNSKSSSNSKSKRGKTTRSDFDANSFCEVTTYSPAGSNEDEEGSNVSSENLDRDGEDSNEQEDVFVNIGGVVKQEFYSENEEDNSPVIKQVYNKPHSRNKSRHNNGETSESTSAQSSDNSILKHIMIKLDRITSTNEHNFRIISAQNNEIIKQQISINNHLKMLDKRIQRIEGKLQCDVKINDFGIDIINNVEELKQFLSEVQSDREYNLKCTAYLHKHCPKGTSKHTHYGVIKGIIDKLFSPHFKNICGWASEKTKKNSDNPPNTKSNRVLLSEYHIFQKLILDVLNFNSVESFTMEHVVEGIKEYYKRFPRKAVDSESEGGSFSFM